jgi:hypothetical protein
MFDKKWILSYSRESIVKLYYKRMFSCHRGQNFAFTYYLLDLILIHNVLLLDNLHRIHNSTLFLSNYIKYIRGFLPINT